MSGLLRQASIASTPIVAFRTSLLNFLTAIVMSFADSSASSAINIFSPETLGLI